jgi:hypothetical protein
MDPLPNIPLSTRGIPSSPLGTPRLNLLEEAANMYENQTSTEKSKYISAQNKLSQTGWACLAWLDPAGLAWDA